MEKGKATLATADIDMCMARMYRHMADLVREFRKLQELAGDTAQAKDAEDLILFDLVRNIMRLSRSE